MYTRERERKRGEVVGVREEAFCDNPTKCMGKPEYYLDLGVCIVR